MALLGKPEKNHFLKGRAIKRVGWGEAGPLRKKVLFLIHFFIFVATEDFMKKVLIATWALRDR